MPRELWVHPRDRKHPIESKPPLWDNKDWWQAYQDWQATLFPSSAQTYDYVLRQLFTDPQRLPDAYTQAEVYAFLRKPTLPPRGSGGPPSPNTYNLRLTALKSFLAFAAGRDIQRKHKTHPLYERRAPTHNISVVESPLRDRSLSDDEVRRFFSVISKTTLTGLRDRALFLTYFWTGRRLREVRLLTWSDIRQNVLFEDGRQGVQYTWMGKGRVTKSMAELPQAAWSAIQIYLQESGRWDHMLPTTYIFVGHDVTAKYRAEGPLTKNTIEARYRRYTKRAGLVGKGGPHDLRHSCAHRWYEESGENLSIVQQKLDHRTPNATMRYLTGAGAKGDAIALRLMGRYGDL